MSTGIWMGIAALLAVICILEAFLLYKDGGTVSNLIQSASELAAARGWISVIRPAASMIVGKVKSIGKGWSGSRFQDEKLHIAFSPSGGLGDYIISASILEELQQIADCEISVFGDKPLFLRTIYGSREQILLRDYNDFERERNEFDLALQIEHFVHVRNVDWKRLERLSPELTEKIRYITEHWEDLYIPIRKQCFRERIQFERCRLLGLDRWSELRMGEAFGIREKKIRIPMELSWKEKWEETGFEPCSYITLNYGTDRMRAGQDQLKMWPREYFEELIRLIRAKQKTLHFVQLGSAGAEKIQGCDRYLLGESLELSKWVLKGALLHVDCEGGLVHLARQLGTRSVVVFGPTPQHMYAYPENINLQSEMCGNCMGLHTDWAYSCYRKEKCPLCMRDVTPQRMFERIMAEHALEQKR